MAQLPLAQLQVLAPLLMAQLRMLPPALARLHPLTGAPHLAVLLNAALIAIATVTLRFEALLELSMIFYSVRRPRPVLRALTLTLTTCLALTLTTLHAPRS